MKRLSTTKWILFIFLNLICTEYQLTSGVVILITFEKSCKNCKNLQKASFTFLCHIDLQSINHPDSNLLYIFKAPTGRWVVVEWQYFWSKVPVCECKLGFKIDPSSCILTLFDGRFMTDFSVGRFRRKYRSVVFVWKTRSWDH